MEEESKKHCSDCDQDLPREEFGNNRSRKDGLSHICRACSNRRTVAWKLAHPARALELVRESQARKRKRERRMWL